VGGDCKSGNVALILNDAREMLTPIEFLEEAFPFLWGFDCEIDE
jgi:hypothetical protein